MVQKKKRAKNKRKEEDLTIHFMPYSDISNEDSLGRIRKIIKLIREDKIIILQGFLKPEEEVKLIEHSMILAGSIDGFSGIEIATLSGNDDKEGVFKRLRRNIARILIGEQDKITIIGPANIVKEIKKNPTKMELMLARR
jgi:hypothetical protein